MSIPPVARRIPSGSPSLTVNALLTVASRDVRRFLGDRERVISTLVFPLIFIGVLGGTSQKNLSQGVGYDFLPFIFIGVLAQNLFQSAALGIISLVEDRENDFSQELFIAPISRYAIIGGKILGESLVAMTQAVAIILFGLLLFGIRMTGYQLLLLVPISIACCLLGGAFGVLMLSLANSQRAANQIFPFLLLPQFFLGGVLTPIRNLDWYLEILSRISPLRYAVDLARWAYYLGRPESSKVVLASPIENLAVMGAMFTVFLVAGTLIFVRNERNR